MQKAKSKKQKGQKAKNQHNFGNGKLAAKDPSREIKIERAQ